MALIKCKDCGKEFSTDAKVCPHCGAKKPKRKSNVLWMLSIVTIMVVFGSLFSKNDSSSQDKVVAQSEKAAQEEFEQSIENKKIEKAKNFALIGATNLQKAMRNPNSLKFESVFVTNDGDACYSYMAENGFGGINKEYAVLTKKLNFYANNSSKWNKLCANKEGIEVQSFINIYISK